MALPPKYNPRLEMSDDDATQTTTGVFTYYSCPVRGTYAGNGVWVAPPRPFDPRNVRVLEDGTIMDGTTRCGNVTDGMTPEARAEYEKQVAERGAAFHRAMMARKPPAAAPK